MANVLGALFGDIANAIREKTGGTATMKPAEFPAEIAAIETGGGGGGGGSLPPGLYLKPVDLYLPATYRGNLYEIDGDKYFFSSYYDKGDEYDLYKYTDGAFVKFASKINFLGYILSGARLLNGKLHFISSGKHVAWTIGAVSVTTLSKLPASGSGDHTCVWNNKLVAFLEDGGLYEWDEETDTWTLIATLSSKYQNGNLFVVNGELYAARLKLIYHFQNGALVQIGSIPFNLHKPLGVKGNAIYYLVGRNPDTNKTWDVRKFDVISKTETVVGAFVCPNSNYYAIPFSNDPAANFKIFNGVNDYYYIVELIEVGE